MTKDFVEALARIDEKIARGPREQRDQRYTALSALERELYDVNCFHFEYVSGGLGGYFTNAASAHWRETLTALQRIGATEAYEALQKACGLFPKGGPSSDPAKFEEEANDAELQRRLETIAEIDDVGLMDRLEQYWRAQTRP